MTDTELKMKNELNTVTLLVCWGEMLGNFTSCFTQPHRGKSTTAQLETVYSDKILSFKVSFQRLQSACIVLC